MNKPQTENVKSLEEKLRAMVEKRKNAPVKTPEKIKETKTEEKRPKEENLKEEVSFDDQPTIPQINNAPAPSPQLMPRALGFDAPIVANPGGRLEDDLRDISTPKENNREEKKLYDNSQKKYSSPDERTNSRIDASTQANLTHTSPLQQVRPVRFADENMPPQNSSPEESYKFDNIQRADNNSENVPWETNGADVSKKYQRHNF
jgi:hypothetical protein